MSADWWTYLVALGTDALTLEVPTSELDLRVLLDQALCFDALVINSCIDEFLMFIVLVWLQLRSVFVVNCTMSFAC